MRKRINADAVFAAETALSLPVIIILIFVSRASAGFISAIGDQADAVESLRQRISDGSIFIPSVITDILTGHFYPSFILALILGGRAAQAVLYIAFYLRFGLLSLGMYIFCAGKIRMSRLMSLAFGLAYSFCALSIAACLEPLLMNILTVMPFAAFAADTVMRTGSRRSVWLAAGIYACFASGGFYGILAGIVFVLSVYWFYKGLMSEPFMWPAFKALLMSAAFCIPVLLPVFSRGIALIDIKEAVKNSAVTYKFFDMLVSMLDGASVNVRSQGHLPVMSLSVLILMAVLLFFFNRNIPFRARFTGFLLIILLPLSVSWSLMSELLSVSGSRAVPDFSRMCVLCMLLFIMAAIGLKNARNIPRSPIYGAVFAVLALTVISNASASSEVSRSAFCLRFSFAAAVFWGIFLLLMQGARINMTGLRIFTVIGMAGLVVNFVYSLGVSDLSGSFGVPSVNGPRDNGINMAVDDVIPLYRGLDEAVVIPKDMRDDGADSFPGLINKLSEEASGEPLLEPASFFTVFTEGVSESLHGKYLASVPGASCEILVRCENMDPSSRYILFSSFSGMYSVTETYPGIERACDQEGPFARLLEERYGAVTVRQIGAAPAEESELSVWRVDPEALGLLSSRLTGTGPEGGTVSSSGSSGYTTIITSIDYSDDFDVDIKGPDGRVSGDVFDYAGKLAVVFRSSGEAEYDFKVVSDAVIPAISVFLWVLSFAAVMYNVTVSDKKAVKVSYDEKKDL